MLKLCLRKGFSHVLASLSLCVCVCVFKEAAIYLLAYSGRRDSGISLVHFGKSVKSCQLELLIETFSAYEIQHLGAFFGSCDGSYVQLLDLCSFSVPQFS